MIPSLMTFRRAVSTAVLMGVMGACTFSAMAQSADEYLAAHAVSAEKASQVKGEYAQAKFYDGALLTVEGQGFKDTASRWSRLPQRYHGKVTGGVWSAGRASAGIGLRFVTNSPAIYAEWDAPRSSMNHMARSGSNGLDLYEKKEGAWHYVGSGIPATTGTSQSRILPRPYGNEKPNVTKPVPAREYLVFLPTYSETKSVKIGIADGCAIAPAAASDKKPIVFYGTSISQGGCAPRSGLGHIERLRRALDYPTINLGFSGSGKCEPIMADLLAEIPAALYVIETVPNMTDDMVRERTLPFIKKLREKQPSTPILMVESPNVPLNSERNAEWKKIYDQALADGVKQIHYLEGDELYGPADNPTVDTVHPTDLGFYQMAVHYEPVLREILGLKSGGSSAKNL